VDPAIAGLAIVLAFVLGLLTGAWWVLRLFRLD
jgi:hypothetical protein